MHATLSMNSAASFTSLLDEVCVCTVVVVFYIILLRVIQSCSKLGSMEEQCSQFVEKNSKLSLIWKQKMGVNTLNTT